MFLSIADRINFAADVKVSAATDNPFLMAVVSQDMLESTTELHIKVYKTSFFKQLEMITMYINHMC